MAASPADRVKAMMEHYDPKKVSSVPQMLTQFKGKEDQLLAALVKRYGPEPGPNDTPAPASAAAAPAATPPAKAVKAPAGVAPKKAPVAAAGAGAGTGTGTLPERISRMIEHYDPSKASIIPKLLEQAQGKEQQILDGLVKKYGAEPPAPSAAAAPATAAPATAAPKKAPSKLPIKTALGAGTPTAAPGAAPTPAAEAPGDSDSRGTFEERARRMLETYDAGKAANVAALVKATGGDKAKEAAVLKQLVTRYGPEPDAPAAATAPSGTAAPKKVPPPKLAAKKVPLPAATAETPAAAPAATPTPAPAAPAAAVTPAAATPVAATPGAAAGGAPEPDSREDLQRRIRRMIQHYEPKRNVDVFLKASQGKEKMALRALKNKHGEEPPPSPEPEPLAEPAPTPVAPAEATAAPPAGPAAVATPTSAGAVGAVSPVAAADAAQVSGTFTGIAAAPTAPAVPGSFVPPPGGLPFDSAGHATGTGKTARTMVQLRVLNFVAKMDPGFMAEAEAMLAENVGKETELLVQLHRKFNVPMERQPPEWLEKLRKLSMAFGFGEHFVNAVAAEHGMDEPAVTFEVLSCMFPDSMANILLDEAQLRAFCAKRLAKFLSVHEPSRVESVVTVLKKYDGHPLTTSLGDVLLRSYEPILRRAAVPAASRAVLFADAPAPGVTPPSQGSGTLSSKAELIAACNEWSEQRARLATPSFGVLPPPVPPENERVAVACGDDVPGRVTMSNAETQTEEMTEYREGPLHDQRREELVKAGTLPFADLRKMRAKELYGGGLEATKTRNNPFASPASVGNTAGSTQAMIGRGGHGLTLSPIGGIGADAGISFASPNTTHAMGLTSGSMVKSQTHACGFCDDYRSQLDAAQSKIHELRTALRLAQDPGSTDDDDDTALFGSATHRSLFGSQTLGGQRQGMTNASQMTPGIQYRGASSGVASRRNGSGRTMEFGGGGGGCRRAKDDCILCDELRAEVSKLTARLHSMRMQKDGRGAAAHRPHSAAHQETTTALSMRDLDRINDDDLLDFL